MRSSVKSTIGVITLGVLGASWYMGQSATAVANGSFAAPASLGGSSAGSETTNTASGSTSTGSTSNNSSGSASSSGSSSTGTKSNASSSSSSTNGGSTGSASNSSGSSKGSSGSSNSNGGSTASTPSPSANQSSSGSVSSASVTKNGDSVESGFGPVQVQVTKSNGTITNIVMLQAVASNGRAAAFPYLVQYAIAANGSNFGNLSGATYTTTAFKRSLESALAKF